MQISSSILSASNKVEAINKLNNTNIDYIHLDVMDGLFVNNKSFDIDEIIKLVSISKKKIDAHFMVNNPINYIDKLKNVNLDYFTFHVEVDSVNQVISKLKNTNYKIGLSIKPNTNLNTLIPYLDDIDLILIMSVEPGYGGQKFLETTYKRIEDIKKIIKNKNILLEVDGGINSDNIKLLDVDIAVVGSFITNSDNYQEQIDKLK